MDPHGRPERTEAADYYFKYIDLVPDGDIRALLEAQLSDMTTLLEQVTPERVDYRYAPDKWSISEVVGHLNDTERLFAFRAFWFARGFDSTASELRAAHRRGARRLRREAMAKPRGRIPVAAGIDGAAVPSSATGSVAAARYRQRQSIHRSCVGLCGCGPRDASREDSPRTVSLIAAPTAHARPLRHPATLSTRPARPRQWGCGRRERVSSTARAVQRSAHLIPP